MERSTRSGKSFAQWDGPMIVPNNPDFDFPKLVREAIALEAALCDEEEEAEEVEDYPRLPPSGSSDSESEGTAAPSGPSQDQPALVQDEPAPLQDPPFFLETPASQLVSNNKHEETTDIEEDIEETAHERRKRKKCNRQHFARNKKRQSNNESMFSHHTARPAVQDKYMKTAVPILSAQKLEETSNVASTGWVGLDDRVRDNREYTLEELVGPLSKFKFDYVEWTGDKPIPIVSQEGILTAVLAGKPEDPNWPRLTKEAADHLKRAHQRCQVPDSALIHRRGAFVALQCGVSHGGGQKQPSNLRCGGRTNAKILRDLNKAEPFWRLAGFATSVMAHWAPELHAYYATHLAVLHKKYPSLRRTFRSSVFAASSYNLGPKTVCFKHTDFGNLPFGWCAVTAFGDYDPSKGGHLILWDCHLVIEFPPGATILLPSATVTHSNVPISEHETRFSFAQYTAGAVFRWVENDFQKATSYTASLSAEELAEKIQRDRDRWSFGLSLLPRYAIHSPSSPAL